MDIKDLDEYQGLTADMVRNWMFKHGWVDSKSGGHMEHPEYGTLAIGQTERVVAFLATFCVGTASVHVQSLLRELNPRLRPWPSAAARAAHRGFWLAVCAQDGTACMGRFQPDVEWFAHSGKHILTEEDNFARFWPVDGNCQRVRWPEKDGVML